VAPARKLAAALPRDAADPVDGVLNGPLSSEQPDGQPVAAEPTNVGENCPRLDVVTALARAPAAVAVAAPAVPPKALSSATGSDSNDSSATRLRMMLLCMPSPLTGSELMPAVAGFRPRENQRTMRASPAPGPGCGLDRAAPDAVLAPRRSLRLLGALRRTIPIFLSARQ
jgi:hypothetical protein